MKHGNAETQKSNKVYLLKFWDRFCIFKQEQWKLQKWANLLPR